eukprot:6933101-Alexandrium_andersonii.AAC.1
MSCACHRYPFHLTTITITLPPPPSSSPAHHRILSEQFGLNPAFVRLKSGTYGETRFLVGGCLCWRAGPAKAGQVRADARQE